MVKNVIKIISTIMLVIVIMNILPVPCYADGMKDISEDLEFWKPVEEPADEGFKQRIGNITGVIRVVGTVISVATIIMIGLKYMFASVEQKADYKQTLIPWLIGAVLIFATTNIPTIIYEFTQGMF